MIQTRVCKQFGFPILQVSREMTPVTAVTLLRAIREVCSKKPRTLGLDLSDVTDYDETCNYIVESAAQWMDGNLKILGMSKAVRRNFRRTA